MGVFGGKGGGGGNQTVTNVQTLPPELAAPLTAAYADFNPFKQAFNQVGAFDPQATKVGTAGLSSGEDFAIQAANSALRTRPAFLGTAQQNLGSLMDQGIDPTALQTIQDIAQTGGTNARLEAQIDDALADVVNNVSSQYALGGRLGSDSFADSLGEGIGSGIAPILAQNLQRDRALELDAAQSLLAGSEADARTRLAAIGAAPGLLGADQALISQAAQLGGLSRGVDQARLDATAAQANQQNILDQNELNAYLSAAGLGSGLFGSTTTQSGGAPSALNQGLGGALAGAGLANTIGSAAFSPAMGAGIGGGLGLLGFLSDRRLKKDIKQIGTHANGLAMYSWQWNDEAQSRGFDIYPTEGFMAQEARGVYPQHVHVHPSGYLMLDYASLSNETMGAA